MRAFVLSRQKFPFTTLFIGIFLGLFVVLDPFITNIIVCKIELTIPILNKNIFKLYPYEISSFLFLIIIISIYIKKLAAYIFLNSEKAFLVLYLIGVQTIALTRVGRIDSSEIIVIVFLLLFAVKYMVVHKKVTVTPFDLMNLLFTISVLLPTFNNGRLFDFLSTVLTVSKLLFIGFLLVTCIENKDNMIFFLKWFVIITGVSSVIAILQEIAYIVLGIPIVGFVDREALRLMIEPTSFGNFLRVPAFLGSYKAFTFFANTAALIIFNYFLYKKLLSIKRRSILIISFLLILISIFLTFSKDAYLALFIGLVLSVLIWRPYFIFHLFFYGILSFIIIYLFDYIDDIQSIVYKEIHFGEYRVRLQLFREGVTGFLFNSPWFGVGVGESPRYTGHFYKWPVHNSLVQAADEVGIVGSSIYFVLLCYTFYNTIKVCFVAKDKSDKWISVGLLTGFITFITAIQFHPFFPEKFTWLYMGAVQAYVLVTLKRGLGIVKSNA